MKGYYKLDEWNIIEEGFSAEHHEAYESIFSIGNGAFGQRANFEEKYYYTQEKLRKVEKIIVKTFLMLFSIYFIANIIILKY